MIIVSSTTGDNTVNFIPRDGVPVKIILINETTGAVIEENPSFLNVGYLSQCTISTSLSDQSRYSFAVLDNDNKELYTDLIFCTTQDTVDYSISNGELDIESAPIETTPQYKIID